MLDDTERPTNGRAARDRTTHMRRADKSRHVGSSKALPTPPSAAVIALNRLGFGPRAGDIATFNGLAGNDPIPEDGVLVYLEFDIAPGDRLVLKIGDDGPGVPAEHKDRVRGLIEGADRRARDGGEGRLPLRTRAVAAEGTSVRFLAKPQSNRAVDRLQSSIRRRAGLGIIRTDASLRDMVRSLREGARQGRA